MNIEGERKPHPAVDNLKSDPTGLNRILKNASEQELDELERVLGPVVERMRSQRAASTNATLDANEIKRQSVITQLSADLVNFQGGIKELKTLLTPYCAKNHLELSPTPGNTTMVRPGLNMHWVSQDRKVAIRIMPDSIWMYKKNDQNEWEPTNPE